MPSSLYNALNGEEIRTIIKNRISKEVDNLPFLKRGNSFHRAKVQFAFVMQAYPADVPVPDDKEIEFYIDAKGLDESEDILRRLENIDDSVEKVNELQLLADRVNKLLEEARENMPHMIREHEVQGDIDGAMPDKVRIENELPVTVEEMKGGKRVEKQVSAVQFKQMVK